MIASFRSFFRVVVRSRAAWGVVVAAGIGLPAGADTVVRRDGSRLEGTVVSLDAASVVMTANGTTRKVPRDEVAAIEFGPAPVPLKVEIRNVRSDDAVDVLVDGDPVITGGREGGEWTDITSRLKEGNTPIGLRIRNDAGTWAYRVSLRINGKVTSLACGTPLRRDDPCRCCGHTGQETGTIALPPVWIHVDRALGLAEVLP